MPLTDIACRTAKPRDRDYKLSDEGRLYLLVRPNGSKLWRLNYVFGRKQKTLALGAYPAVTLSAARQARDDAKAKLASDIDPGASRQPDHTFEAVARDWFESRRRKWVTTYSERLWSRLEADVFPEIGQKQVDHIEPKDVLALLRKIEGRGAYEMAKRIRQVMGQVFRYGVAVGRGKHDPAAPLRDAMVAVPRQRHHAALRDTDLPAFFKQLRTYEEPQTRAAIEVVAHTFVRTGEIRFARWSEIEGDIWRIPAERMKMRKEHIVPLTPHVAGLLAELKILADGSDWVLPGIEGRKPISENTMLFAMYRLGYRSRATVHGFRATASTILNESGLWRPDAIERQLAHVPMNEVRSAYNAALYLEERVRMMEWYSNVLLEKAREGDQLGTVYCSGAV